MNDERTETMIKVGIIGATGYAGGELVRILTGHKDAEIKWYGSRSYVEQKYADVYRNMFQIVDAACMDDNMEELAAKAADFLKYMYSPEVASKIYKITLENGELVQGPSLIEGVTFEDEVNEYMKAFESEGTMITTLGDLAGAWTDGDYAVYNDFRIKYVNGDINYDEFIEEISILTEKWVERQRREPKPDSTPSPRARRERR